MPTAVASSTKPNSAYSQETLDALVALRGEPAWLSKRRGDALAFFETAAWPTLRDEEWRRTDIRAMKLAAFPPPFGLEVSANARAEIAVFHESAENTYATGLAHCDGSLVRSPDVSRLPAGVVFTDLPSAVRSHPTLVEKYLLTRAVDPRADALSALHAAFWTSGALLYVPKGVKLNAPLFHNLALSSEGQTDFSHTLVVLEEGAEATLVQETASAARTQPGLHMGAVELILGRQSKLCFVNIQNWDQHTWHFSRERAIVGRDARLQWTVGGLGSRLAKVNQEVALAEPGASAQVNGIMFTTARQNITYMTRQDHLSGHTTSDLLYKGVLKDSSRIVWKGMIKVEKDAQRTDAYQKNDSLLLADSARADSIPGLEIEANDVRCTHGATVGRVDEDMIFYLGARGIPRREAARLIVEGFFAGVYDRIGVDAVRDSLQKAVAHKLNI
jgi:Fe-S cluster assembly protein SufD